MGNIQEAFIFFYGLTWATALSTVSRYRPFDTAGIFHRKDGWRRFLRFLVSLTICNVVPFAVLYWAVILTSQPHLTGDNAKLLPHQLVGAAICSVSAFYMSRTLHGVFASPLRYLFYDPMEWALIRATWSDQREEDVSFLAHLVPGILYAVVPLVVGLLVVRSDIWQ